MNNEDRTEAWLTSLRGGQSTDDEFRAKSLRASLFPGADLLTVRQGLHEIEKFTQDHPEHAGVFNLDDDPRQPNWLKLACALVRNDAASVEAHGRHVAALAERKLNLGPTPAWRALAPLERVTLGASTYRYFKAGLSAAEFVELVPALSGKLLDVAVKMVDANDLTVEDCDKLRGALGAHHEALVFSVITRDGAGALTGAHRDRLLAMSAENPTLARGIRGWSDELGQERVLELLTGSEAGEVVLGAALVGSNPNFYEVGLLGGSPHSAWVLEEKSLGKEEALEALRVLSTWSRPDTALVKALVARTDIITWADHPNASELVTWLRGNVREIASLLVRPLANWDRWRDPAEFDAVKRLDPRIVQTLLSSDLDLELQDQAVAQVFRYGAAVPTAAVVGHYHTAQMMASLLGWNRPDDDEHRAHLQAWLPFLSASSIADVLLARGPHPEVKALVGQALEVAHHEQAKLAVLDALRVFGSGNTTLGRRLTLLDFAREMRRLAEH